MADFSKISILENGQETRKRIRLYKRRWFMLCLFVICCVSSLMQWIQYSIIANIVVEYYGVSYTAVDWSSMIYMLVCVPFIFVGCYVIETWGLRKTILISMIGTCIGSWIKVGSVSPDRYWVVLFGQGIVGIFGVLLLAAYSKLAALWFAPHEASLACSIGVFGSEFGIAIGFLLPPMLFDNATNTDSIERGFYKMTIGVATITTIVLVIICAAFREQPPSPPSAAQLRVQKSTGRKRSAKTLLTNSSYILLVLSYGINVGIFYAMSTLLNQIILLYYPSDGAIYAGRIGFIIVISGMVGSILCGVILEAFNMFKLTIMSVYVSCILSLMVFTFTLNSGILVVYFSSALLGLFMIALLPIGYEVAAELTYPVNEATSRGLLTAAGQIFGIGFTYLYSYFLNNINDIPANLGMSGILALGALLLFLIRFDLQRQTFNTSVTEIDAEFQF